MTENVQQTYILLFHTSMSITNVGKEEGNIRSKQIGTTRTDHNVTYLGHGSQPQRLQTHTN